ncbi:MAG: hypothetical protein P8L18_14265 [Verrucomicrobiota bacterium]|nr:hypothetical protein [Verrucomicrobiota bacterium]
MKPIKLFTVCRVLLKRCLLFFVTLSTAVSAATVYNASFELNYSEGFPHYGEVEEWQGGSGVNQANGPFHNGGTPIPDQARVAFIQGTSTLSQEIVDLEPGELHWLQFFYDARNCCGGTIDLVVKIDDVELGKITNVKPSTDGNPYKFSNIPFTPEFDAGILTFQTVASGDATLNLDGIAIIRRGEGQVPVMNPSFEASGEPVDQDGIISPNGIAGWVGEGTYGVNADGSGTFADNGRSSEPDFVGFLTDVSSLAQILDGLIVGNDYVLTFEYNATAGDSPELVVALGGEEVFRESVSAVGGNSQYRQGTVKFTADDVQKLLSFRQTNEGDHTVLLDSIHLAGEVGESFPPMEVNPSALELAPGQMGEVTLTLPDAYIAIKGGQVRFTSPNPGVAVPVGADEGGILIIEFEQGGATSKTIQIEGVARGAARMVVVPPSGLDLANDTAVNVVSSFVRNASFESNEAPPGIGAGAIVSWSGGTGLNKGSGPFHDNGAIPDRRQVAVVQGSQTLSQEISGLTEGDSYWLQFHYNARNCCGGTIGLTARFAGEELWQMEDVIPSTVDGLETYYFQNVSFKASASSGLLEFVTTAEGDATILLDAVNIVSRGESEIVIVNPSFEASGSPVGVGYVQPANIAGWEFTSGGRGPNVTGQGPFSDNGSGLDQDSVLFIQGPTSMTQLIEGLEPGETYTLYYYVNARNCCGEGGITFYSVSFDEEILLEEEVLPVGGNNPYHLRYVTFKASFADGILQFDTQPEGDHSFLLDDIHIVKGEFVPPTPQPADVLLVLRRLADHSLELRWPAAVTAFVLQRTETLGGDWTDVNEAVVVDGDENTVTVTPGAGSAFFRLLSR